MKQDAANHWKIQDLGRALARRLAGSNLGPGLTPELSRRLAMGVVESLWIWSKRYYPRGDIGRASDERITAEAGWDPEDACWFIATLRELRLIDAHRRYRLIVHDLSDHAEDHVRKALERAGIATFADGRPVRKDGPGRPRRRSRTAASENLDNVENPASESRAETPPALPSRSRAEPSPALPSPAAAAPSHAGPSRAEIIRDRGGGSMGSKHNGIGSVAAAVGRPEHWPIVQALRKYWPAPDRLPEELATHPNATIERVLWLIEQAEKTPMRTGERGKGGYIRTGIEKGFEVPADWIAGKRERFENIRAGASA